jgi:cation diffusion facilitator family transporter
MASPGSIKVIFAALIGNLLVSLTKFTAAFITGSSAMLSEGIHSVVDTGNQILLLYGIKRSKQPADENFPFGYGKEVYFWSFIVAILIFAVGSGLSIYEGIHQLTDPRPISNVYVNYIVLGLAIAFEAAVWWIALKEFNKERGRKGIVEAIRKQKNPSTFVVFLEDSAALLGLTAALIGIMISHTTGNTLYDGIASVIIGLILAMIAAFLAYETKGLLIGERANLHIIRNIKTLVSAHESVDHVNEVLTLHMGPEFILVNISVDFKDDLKSGDLEVAIVELDKMIKEQHDVIKRIFIEAEAKHIK